MLVMNGYKIAETLYKATNKKSMFLLDKLKNWLVSQIGKDLARLLS